MPPSRNASGVEPPADDATPETFSSIAMPGASTDTEIAMASQTLSEPCASSSWPVVTSRLRSTSAMVVPPLLHFLAAAAGSAMRTVPSSR